MPLTLSNGDPLVANLLEGAEGLGWGGVLDPLGTGRTFGRSFGRSDGWMDGRKFPVFYRTSSPSGPLPKSVPKMKERYDTKHTKLSFKMHARVGPSHMANILRPTETSQLINDSSNYNMSRSISCHTLGPG